MLKDIHELGLLQASALIRRGDISSESVTEALLDRIGRYEPRLNSVMMLQADTALDQARRADREIAAGQWRGPLHGVPIGVKDLLWTKGLPTTAGMEHIKDFRPAEDATVVARLKRAGAVLIAKLHMTEAATFDHHPAFPRPVNPWSEAHWTGVSSSGSGVATAAGFCYGAIGTDTGGSIRMPSSANNLTGIKPTWGRVSRHGLIPLAESLDHIGPLARSAEDAAAILQAIAGADPKDPTALTAPVPDYLSQLRGGVSDLVVGVDWTYAAGDVDPEVAAAVRQAVEILRDLGVRVREIRFPWDDAVALATGPLIAAEIALAHAEHMPRKADRYSPRTRALIERGFGVGAVALARAYQARDQLKGRMLALFQEVDLIIAPGIGEVLPTWERMETLMTDRVALSRALLAFTSPFNLTGVPTISLPAGFTAQGLPVGVQLAAAPLAEPGLLRAGVAFQGVSDFHTRRPVLN